MRRMMNSGEYLVDMRKPDFLAPLRIYVINQ